MTTISLEEISEEEDPVDTFPSNDFPPYKTMLRMIESLPEGYSTVFKLAILEGLSHKEISLLLNIAPHSSSSQLSRAKDMLRKLISQYRIVIGLFILSSIISIVLGFVGSLLIYPFFSNDSRCACTDEVDLRLTAEHISLTEGG